MNKATGMMIRSLIFLFLRGIKNTRLQTEKAENQMKI